jgi:2-polyprenyl-6-methoxyphenol hydroxylase-like FAD-dependent oxidoreductase
VAADDIVIVGAGPAGLMLAWHLASNGVPVRVLERHPDFAREFRGEYLQPSGLAALAAIGVVEELRARGLGEPIEEGALVMDGKLVMALGAGAGGLAVSQPGLLGLLDESCRRFPHYRLDLESAVTDVVRDESGRACAVTVRAKDGAVSRVEASLVVACNGRGSALRRHVDARVSELETPFEILWLRLHGFAAEERPKGGMIVGHADSVFVYYAAVGGAVQLAWAKRAGAAELRTKDPAELKRALLAAAPDAVRRLVERGFDERTPHQILKVVTDRLDRWHAPGLLLLGDAAHTMSPIGGQGVNIALRDAVVAANHLIPAAREGRLADEGVLEAIQRERAPEIERVQRFQAGLARVIFELPRWRRRFFFGVIAPLLRALGLVRPSELQQGVALVVPKFAVRIDEQAPSVR